MTTDYDPIAEQYQRSKQQPWRTYIEADGLMRIVGDVAGQSVLDVACGEGYYTRMIRQRGAGPVLGVDLSPGMIDLARQQEARHQLGIEYVEADATQFRPPAPFDLVVAAYLLNYAATADELQRMCDGIVRCLKPGGRFITVNGSPVLHFPSAPSFRKYGFETSVRGAWQTGTPITWKFYLSDSVFEIENYHLDLAQHEQALRSAGFREIRWHGPQVSPEGLRAFDQSFWGDFLESSPVIFLECRK